MMPFLMRTFSELRLTRGRT